MVRNKIGDADLQSKTVNLLKRSGMPVSVDYVAHNLNIAWSTARGLLLELALEGRIVAEKTTKSWIFWIPMSENVAHAEWK